MKMGKMSLNTFVSKYSRILLLLLICVALLLATPKFFTSTNLINVLRQSSMLLMMSLGMMYAMLLGRGVDMCIGSTLALSSCLAAYFMKLGASPIYTIVGVALAVVIGLAVGVLNGGIIAYLRLPAILVTLGTREIVRGIAYLLMSDKVITNLPRAIQFLGTGRVLGKVPMPVVIAAIFVLLTAFMLKYTAMGRRIYLVGANPVAARFSGIHDKRAIVFGFTMSSLFAALAGLVYIGRLDAAEPMIGETFAFQCVGAVAIGGTSFNGGIGTAWGAVVGAIIMTLLLNGMNLLNISSSWQGTVNGLVIIVAVLLDYFATRQRT